MTTIKATKIGLTILFIAAVLTSLTLPPSDAPYLPLIAWPLAYLPFAYWMGNQSLGEKDFELSKSGDSEAERDLLRHRAGLSWSLHGAAVGLLVAAVAVLIRANGVYPFSRRLISLITAGAGGMAIYLYTRHVAKQQGGSVLMGVIIFGGLPIWNQFFVTDDD